MGHGGAPWGQFNGPHSLTVDQEGNLYIAEVFNGRVQKFRPKPGADPAKLIGPESAIYTAIGEKLTRTENDLFAEGSFSICNDGRIGMEPYG